MVIPDLSASLQGHSLQPKPATTVDRFLAGVFDILLLVPLATFVPSMHIREARLDYIQGFESNIWYQIVLLWILSYIVLQTVFLYFTKTTPGGMIMGVRVHSLNGSMSWNQCLLRSTFSFLSWLFLCLPFLEVITHPVKRAWHDRVSDTIVIDTKTKPTMPPFANFNVQWVRVLMTLGIFVMLVAIFSFINDHDELTYISESSSGENVDSFVAQALLKKDFSEETQYEVEERIWSSRKRIEKALAYFFKLQVETDRDVRKTLVEQICIWSTSQKSGSLCGLSRYSLDQDDKVLQVLAQNPNDVPELAGKVFLMKELTKKSKFAGALKIYKKIKDQKTLGASFHDSLKIWDVSLFWAIRENQLKAKRLPASEDEVSAVIEYAKERSLP